MSMPVDVETLLNRQRIESERIEFKRGRNQKPNSKMPRSMAGHFSISLY